MRDEMGECLIQVPVRLTMATAQRMDGDVKRFPFCEGRSAIARKLVELAYAAIDAGILEFEPGTLQQVLGNLERQKDRSVRSVPALQAITEEHAGQPWSQVKARNKKP